MSLTPLRGRSSSPHLSTCRSLHNTSYTYLFGRTRPSTAAVLSGCPGCFPEPSALSGDDDRSLGRRYRQVAWTSLKLSRRTGPVLPPSSVHEDRVAPRDEKSGRPRGRPLHPRSPEQRPASLPSTARPVSSAPRPRPARPAGLSLRPPAPDCPGSPPVPPIPDAPPGACRQPRRRVRPSREGTPSRSASP